MDFVASYIFENQGAHYEDLKDCTRYYILDGIKRVPSKCTSSPPISNPPDITECSEPGDTFPHPQQPPADPKSVSARIGAHTMIAPMHA